jgi:hypothetical protein
VVRHEIGQSEVAEAVYPGRQDRSRARRIDDRMSLMKQDE